jgi:hypothetical protein
MVFKEDETDGTRSTHGSDEKRIQNCGRKNVKGRDHSEDFDVNGRIIFEWILRK